MRPWWMTWSSEKRMPTCSSQMKISQTTRTKIEVVFTKKMIKQLPTGRTFESTWCGSRTSRMMRTPGWTAWPLDPPERWIMDQLPLGSRAPNCYDSKANHFWVAAPGTTLDSFPRRQTHPSLKSSPSHRSQIRSPSRRQSLSRPRLQLRRRPRCILNNAEKLDKMKEKWNDLQGVVEMSRCVCIEVWTWTKKL